MNTLSAEQYPVFSVRFLTAYITTMRPYLMFVSGITGIAGMSFSAELDIAAAALIFPAAFLSYGFGQALTDCFQIDTDSISSPYRPLTKGVVNRNYFLLISLVGLFLCITVFAFYNPLNIGFGILAGTGLATYTYFKRKWWSGPFYNSWIVLLLFIMSYFAASGISAINFSNIIFDAAAVTVFFGYANFVLTGYFKDIEADRSTAYNTLPVVFGRKISAIVSNVIGLIICITVLVTLFTTVFASFPPQTIFEALIFISAGIYSVIITQFNLASVKSDSEAHKAIVPCLHSYILLLSGLTILNKPDWFLPLIFFYLLYLLTMKTRPVKGQI